MAKKIEIPYKYFIEKEDVKFDNGNKEYEKIRFTMPSGENVIIEISKSYEYYPEDKDTYGYPNNPDDRVVYYLGDDTYDFVGCITVYDDAKIRTRRALVRAYHNEENYKEGVIKISETYLKEK
jgi:hypothetical protein